MPIAGSHLTREGMKRAALGGAGKGSSVSRLFVMLLTGTPADDGMTLEAMANANEARLVYPGYTRQEITFDAAATVVEYTPGVYEARLPNATAAVFTQTAPANPVSIKFIALCTSPVPAQDSTGLWLAYWAIAPAHMPVASQPFTLRWPIGSLQVRARG